MHKLKACSTFTLTAHRHFSTSYSVRRLSKEKLKEYLHANASADGSMSFPSERWPADLSGHEEVFADGAFRSRFPRVGDAETLKLGDYVTNTFYSMAPIPKVLGLPELIQEGNQYMKQEIGSLLDSGLTQVFEEVSTGEVAHVGLSSTWSRNKDRQVLDCSNEDWLNAAAEVAMERQPDSRKQRVVTWRDLQLQMLYNIAQQLIAEADAERAIYAFASFADEKFRHHRLSMHWLRDLGELASKNNAIMFGIVTFYMDERMIAGMKELSRLDLINVTPYSKLHFDVDGDGSNIWADLAKTKGGMYIFQSNIK